MDHAAYINKTKRMTFDQLTYTISDCRQALVAQPMGHKAGHYTDEIHYCAAELAARRAKAATQIHKPVLICQHCHQPVME